MILENMFETIATSLPNIIGALLFLFVGWLVAKWISKSVERWLESKNVNQLLTFKKANNK